MQLFNFETAWRFVPPTFLDMGMRSQTLRSLALKRAEKELFKHFAENPDNLPPKVAELRTQSVSNLLRSIERAVADGRIGDDVRRSILQSFIGAFVIQDTQRLNGFLERYGFEPPSFLVISPTKKCNLRCKGCYAGSSAHNAETLDYAVLHRLIREKTEEWGSHLTVLSGGEPLLYQSGSKDLFDLLQDNKDNYFMAYTNSTLITRDVAEKMARLGNISPAISVEGWEKETDARSGKGIFSKILQAMENLRAAGVPFGISTTATRENAEVILSDEFVDFFFHNQGAVYGWIFQYMPIGRSFTVDLMVTPEQRRWMLQKQMEIIYDKKLFYVDFWNGGPLTIGCISAGRSGGYFYVDWNGNIAPCAFFPYYIDNVYEIYRKKLDMTAVLESEYFRGIRAWQHDYAYQQPPEKMKNLFLPCPYRDHYQDAYRIIQRHGAKAMDENAAKAIGDEAYRQKMIASDERVGKLLDPVWQREFCGLCQDDLRKAV